MLLVFLGEWLMNVGKMVKLDFGDRSAHA
jgi:hypothetical protein